MVHVLLGNHEEMNITGIALDYPGYVTRRAVPLLPARRTSAWPGRTSIIKTLPPGGAQEPPGRRARNRPTRTPCYGFWQRTIARRNPEARQAYVEGFNRDLRRLADPAATSVIKINDVVYAHAGVSETFSRWPLREINTVMRTELAFFQGRMRNPQRISEPFKPKIVYDPDSPLWFRGLATKGERRPRPRSTGPWPTSAPRPWSSATAISTTASRAAPAPIIETSARGPLPGQGLDHGHGHLRQLRRHPLGPDLRRRRVQALGRDRGGGRPQRHQAPARRSPWRPEEMEDFLKTAAVDRPEPGPGGRTDAWRLTLEARGGRPPGPLQVRRPAAARSPARQLPATTWPPTPWTSTSAWASSRPSSSGRSPRTPGALQAFVGNARARKTERRDRQAPARGPGLPRQGHGRPARLPEPGLRRLPERQGHPDRRRRRQDLPGRFLRGLRPQEERSAPLSTSAGARGSSTGRLLAWDDAAVAGAWPAISTTPRSRRSTPGAGLVVTAHPEPDQGQRGGERPVLTTRKGRMPMPDRLPARLPVPAAVRRHPPGRGVQGPPAGPEHLPPPSGLLHPEAPARVPAARRQGFGRSSRAA
ncbi:MAG: hypothetical protein MZW92_02265 [Comamonadaceae bacterium]|nr:hypothetical protein [Comamonadaceae bacterium]